MKLNQKGFSAVEVIILLVIISLIGFIGWRVYDSNQETNKDEDTQTTSQQRDANDTADTQETTKDTTTYTNTASTYSLELPSEWEQQSFEQETFFDSQFNTKNGFVTINHYGLDKPQKDLAVQTDSVWIAKLEDGKVISIDKSNECTGSGDQEYKGVAFTCDAVSTIKTRVEVYADGQLGLTTKEEQVTFSYASKDNIQPGIDLEQLEAVVKSFTSTQ